MKIRTNSFTDELIVKLDESLAGTTYIGFAPLGSATSAATWQIKKMVESAGVTTITFAGPSFNRVWDDRASLTYS